MTQIGWLGEIASKGTVILIAAFLAAGWLRRESAAARHCLWTVTLATLLLLPAAIAVAPQWSIRTPAPVRAAATAHAAPNSGQPVAVTVTTPTGHSSPWQFSWTLAWMLGCAAAGTWFALGAARTRWIRLHATPATYALDDAEAVKTGLGISRRVEVVESARAPVPLACGFLRPTVVLPQGAATWPAGRLHTVLCHELTHIRRHDVVAQSLGNAACCIYWFQPLAWMAARRLRQEREGACDDAVLSGGTPAHEYAADLMEMARGLAHRRHTRAAAAAMAELGDLESRIRGLFDRHRNRQPLRTRLVVATVTAAAAMLLPVASLTVHAQPAAGALAGVVQDASGARVPQCRITARNLDGANQEVAYADAVGEYRFGSIPGGNYAVEFAAPGFALGKKNIAVVSGQPARLDAVLEIGSVSERLKISGQKPPTAAPQAGPPQRIRVGGNVQPVKLLHQTRPVYPAELQQLGIEGTVVLRAVISTEGTVLSPKVMNTSVDPRLAKIALDAFTQWRYQPALLNGQPVETVTTITLEFALESAQRQP